ncbi:MAG: hypothetical protein ABDH91_08415 [Bacteroidia bacterium]
MVKYYLDALLIALFFKCLWIQLLPHWNKGMAMQIWPGYINMQYGVRFPDGDTVSLPPHFANPQGLAQLVLHNPDFPTYYEPYQSFRQCIEQKEGNCAWRLCAFYRMPGYLPWLYLSDALGGMEQGRTWTIGLQLLLGALAAVIFGDLIRLITGCSLWIVPASLMWSSFPFIARYEFIVGSEGFYPSFLILSLWALAKSQWQNRFWITLSGLFILEAMLLRPITAPLFALYTLPFILQRNWHFVYLWLPFIAFETFWLTCTHKVHRKAFLTTKSIFYYENPDEAYDEWWRIQAFMGAFGDNYYWFYYPTYKLPRRAYTSAFNPDTEAQLLILLRRFYSLHEGEAEYQFSQRLREWERSIKREKPLLYHFTSRLYATANFLASHWIESFFYTDAQKAGLVYRRIYGYSVGLWVVVVGLGFLLTPFVLYRARSQPLFLTAALSAHYAWLSYVLLRAIQSRYFLFSLVFFLVLVVGWVGYWVCRRAPST